MPTYQDLIDQLTVEIEDAEKAGQPEIVSEKYSKLGETYMNLGFVAVEAINYSEAYTCFNLASEAAIRFTDHYKNIPAELQDIKLAEDNEQNLLTALGFANFCLGQYNNTTRNPGVAVQYFQQSVIEFEKLSKLSANKFWGVFAKYCAGFKLYAEGMEDFSRASFSNAKLKLQRARIAMGNVIDKELPLIKDEFPGGEKAYEDSVKKFKADHQTVSSIYYLSDAKHQFNNRNFKSAADKFTLVTNEFDVSIKNYSARLNDSLKNITLGEYYNYNGWRLLSQAEEAREKERWEESLKLYDEVRIEWERAAGYYLQSDLPQGLMLQEAISNTILSLDVYQRVCENEKELKTRIAELEEELVDLKTTLANAIKPTGVVVNNTQEVVTTVEQNAQFIQNIENNAREGVKELLEALKESGLDAAMKKDIEQKGTEILKSEEKGSKFLDKVKTFTKDIAEIIKNVGDIAKPLIPGWKLLSFLF